MPVERGKRIWLSYGALAALTVGYLVGAWAQSTDNQTVVDLSTALVPVGRAWSNALRMIVLPLIVAQLVYTIVRASSSAMVARLSALSFGTFTVMTTVAGLGTAAVISPLLPQLQFNPGAIDALRAAVSSDPPLSAAAPTSAVAWVNALIPSNIVQAASQDNLFGVLIIAILFGAAATRLPAERRDLICALSGAVAETTIIMVRGLMWIMPIAVFVLALSLASRNGIGALEVMGTYVVLVCSVMAFWIVILYGVAVIGGGASLPAFARAMMPVHIVAASTRSSIATLPALMESVPARLSLRPEVASTVLPLAVSTFRINYPASSVFQFMFLAHVYGVELSAVQITSFVTAMILMSYSSLGIPSGGGLMRNLPLFLAAGIPIEGYLLSEAVEAIPDVFKTLMNVTGHVTAATVVNRLSAPREAPATRPVPKVGMEAREPL